MKEYLITLFVVSLVAAIIRVASPDGVMKKHIDLLCAICVICVTVSPVILAVSSIDTIKNIFEYEAYEKESFYDEIYNSYISEGNIKASEKILSEDVCRNFNVAVGSISVTLKYVIEEGKLSVTFAKAHVSGEGVAVDPQLIKEYISNRINTDCEIIY